MVFGENHGCLATLWQSYSRYMIKLVAGVNTFMRHETDSSQNADKTRVIGQIFTKMYMLYFFDMAANSGLCRAHAKGFLAYIQHVGGPDVIPALPLQYRAAARFFSQVGISRHHMLYKWLKMCRKIVTINTTTPARQQLLGHAEYTESQIEKILAIEFDLDNPFPMDVRIAVVRTTLLRYQVATKTVSEAALLHAVCGIVHKLDNVDVDGWARTDNPFEESSAYDMGQIFRNAVLLYGIITLPRSLFHSWAQSQIFEQTFASGAESHDVLRTYLTSKLIKQLKKALPLLNYVPSVSWPLQVAGVGVATGSAVDRAFVDGSLFAVWAHLESDIAAIVLLQKLRNFWSAGKTEWEECFDEPCPC